MHFTIDRRRFIKMLESVWRKLPNQKGKQREVRIYSCAARVFVEANGVTAGEEALVLEEGSCFQSMEPFLVKFSVLPELPFHGPKIRPQFANPDRLMAHCCRTLVFHRLFSTAPSSPAALWEPS
jgi:hypothetical protein